MNRNGRLAFTSVALLLAGVATGCSSQSMRFADFVPTGSVNKNQASASANSPMAAAPIQAAPTGSVQRNALTPVSVSGGQVANSQLPPVSSTAGDMPMRSSLPAAGMSGAPVQTASAGSVARQSPAASGPTVTLQPGETVNGLARRYGISANSIIEANGLSDANSVRSGQKLVLPGASAAALAKAPVQQKPQQVAALPAQAPSTPGAAVAKPAAEPAVASAKPADVAAAPKADSVQPAAYTPPKQSAREVVEESGDEQAPDGTGIGRMRWPVRGKVISGFGGGSDGVDIAVPEGTSVKAAENGVVIYSGDGLKEFGNTVLVRHENGLVTVYGHASELKVARGQKVKRGQEIALSGNSGSTEAPKLHFEVRKNSSPVDPKTFLE